MGRRPDPRLKKELLDRFVDYLLEHGLADLSLGPAAAALGTSSRMLIYHFGTKEKLIVAAVSAVRERQMALVAREIERTSPRSPSEVMLSFWRSHTAKAREPFLRFLFEIWITALKDRSRFPGLLEGLEAFQSAFEGGFVSAGMPQADARLRASIYLAALRGLMLDVLTTGDRKRVNAAIRQIANELEGELNRERRGR